MSRKSTATPTPRWSKSPTARRAATLGCRLPFGDGILGRLLQPNRAVYLGDPVHRDDVMLPAGFGIALGEDDLVRAVQAVDGADVLAVRAEHFHVFLDAFAVHDEPPCRTTTPPRQAAFPPVRPRVWRRQPAGGGADGAGR